MGEVAHPVRIVSPFRARAIVLARRLRAVSLQVLHNRSAVLGLGILVFFFVLAVAAPWIAPYGPLEPVTDAPPLSHASPQHPFGVNLLGRDIYSQVIWGSQVSLIVGVMSTFVAIVNVWWPLMLHG